MTEDRLVSQSVETELNVDVARDLRWESVDEFEAFIRAIAPKGRITLIHGSGYDQDEGKPPPPVKLIIYTERRQSEIDAEEAIAERWRAVLAKREARLKRVKQAADERASLEENLRSLRNKLAVATSELEGLLKEGT